MEQNCIPENSSRGFILHRPIENRSPSRCGGRALPACFESRFVFLQVTEDCAPTISHGLSSVHAPCMDQPLELFPIKDEAQEHRVNMNIGTKKTICTFLCSEMRHLVVRHTLQELSNMWMKAFFSEVPDDNEQLDNLRHHPVTL